MDLKVIGVGLGRTGTLSLKQALEILGFGKCYHMMELLKNRSDIIHWESAWQKEKVDWRELFVNFNSSVDYPGCYFYRELLSAYPDAKFILTERDFDSWYESVEQTLLQIHPTLLQMIKLVLSVPFSKQAQYLKRIGAFNQQLIKNPLSDKAQARTYFYDHARRVKSDIPPKQLLVYRIEDGWQPLCEFLGVPVPGEAFPNVNTCKDFKRLIEPLFW